MFIPSGLLKRLRNSVELCVHIQNGKTHILTNLVQGSPYGVLEMNPPSVSIYLSFASCSCTSTIRNSEVSGYQGLLGSKCRACFDWQYFCCMPVFMSDRRLEPWPQTSLTQEAGDLPEVSRRDDIPGHNSAALNWAHGWLFLWGSKLCTSISSPTIAITC